MNEPTVSVLMTAFNREQYIAFAIESVLASTLVDFELIIVDDCSSDATVDIARSYVSRDRRVRVEVNESNIGDYPNRNRAVSYASGKYIKFVDSDDYMYPNCLEYMVGAMEAHPECVIGIMRHGNADSPFPVVISPADAYRRHFLEGGLLVPGPTGAIMRRLPFVENGGFYEFRNIGDGATWLNFAAKGSILILPQDLVWWRRHEGQEFRDQMRTPENYLTLSFNISREALLASTCPLDGESRERALRLLVRSYTRQILRLALQRRSLSFPARELAKSKLSIFDLYSAFSARRS